MFLLWCRFCDLNIWIVVQIMELKDVVEAAELPALKKLVQQLIVTAPVIQSANSSSMSRPHRLSSNDRDASGDDREVSSNAMLQLFLQGISIKILLEIR
jgi:hypothetical protein